MHQDRYPDKIKLYYSYLLSLRAAKQPFLLHQQQELQKLHRCNRYPPSSSKRLTFPRISFIFVSPSLSLLSRPLSCIVFLFSSIGLARSRLVTPYCLPSREKVHAQHCADPELRRSGNCVKFTVERCSIDCGVCI